MRAFAALAVTSLAAVTLLLGPDATLGLDLPTAGGTGPVTQVTQQVSSTVQQTAQPVVTNVETAVPQTVQTSQQIATQVQQTAAAPVTAAPKAPTASPPVKRVVAAKPVRTVTTKAKPVASPTHAAVGAGSAAKPPSTVASVTQTATRARTAIRSAHASPARKPAREADGGCASSSLVGSLGSLLGPLSQSTLGALLCNVTSALTTPQTLTANETAAGPRFGGLLAVIASSVPARLRVLAYAKSAAQRPFALGGGGVYRDKRAKATIAATGGAVAYGATSAGFAPASSPELAQAGHSSSTTAAGGHHGGLFGSSITGTEAIFALLVADWALLVAVTMWKLARRRRRRLAFGF